jgi:phenylpyruvate tautomerase PptA (4-oxalocrotonate tautomerase family)
VITAHDSDSLRISPNCLGIARSAQALIIDITLNAGRSTELKQQFYTAVVDRLNTEAQVRPEDVFIGLTEVPKENWSFGGRARRLLESPPNARPAGRSAPNARPAGRRHPVSESVVISVLCTSIRQRPVDEETGQCGANEEQHPQPKPTRAVVSSDGLVADLLLDAGVDSLEFGSVIDMECVSAR